MKGFVNDCEWTVLSCNRGEVYFGTAYPGQLYGTRRHTVNRCSRISWGNHIGMNDEAIYALQRRRQSSLHGDGVGVYLYLGRNAGTRREIPGRAATTSSTILRAYTTDRPDYVGLGSGVDASLAWS